jgi:hypothetical protein
MQEIAAARKRVWGDDKATAAEMTELQAKSLIGKKLRAGLPIEPSDWP